MSKNILKEAMARYADVDISGETPEIPESYTPIEEKYICICTGGDAPSNIYAYYDLVLNLLAPTLQKLKIKVYQIGEHNDLILRNCISRLGQDHKQNVYLLNNCTAFINGDNYLSSYTYDHGIPTVALYGSSRPNMARNDNFVTLHKFECSKPTYAAHEKPKKIDKIKPEKVANSILKFLNEPKVKYKTQYIGPAYSTHVNHYQIIPDHLTGLQYSPNAVFDIRGDLHHDEDLIFKNLGIGKTRLHLNKPIDWNVLKYLRLHQGVEIEFISYDITMNFLENPEDLKKAGVPFAFTGWLDNKRLKEAKFKYMDYAPVLEHRKFESAPKSFKNNCYFQSNKIFTSKDGNFLSEWHYRNNKPFSNNYQKLEKRLDKTFLKDIVHFNIFKI